MMSMQMHDIEYAKRLYANILLFLLSSNFHFCHQQGKEIQDTIFLENYQILLDNY